MNRRIDREFQLSREEVIQAIHVWLKLQDMPVPVEPSDLIIPYDNLTGDVVVSWSEILTKPQIPETVR